MNHSSTNYLRNWICTNERRVDYLKNKCQNMKATIEYHHARLIEDKQHNLLYCEVSKAGCTSVKRIWMEANLRMSGSNTMNVSGFTLYGPSVHNPDNLKTAGLYLHKMNNWTNEFKQYIKFIAVRHPYDRLVSAYYNVRFWKPGQADAHTYVTGHFKERFLSSLHGDLKLLTFEQFLTVVTDNTIRLYQDRHWKPYTESCYVCHVEYDYILKTETLYHDMEQIIKLLGHQDMKLVQMNAHKRDTDSGAKFFGKGDNSESCWYKHLPEYGSLCPEIKQAIAHRYRHDMEMFGYYFNEKTNIASCCLNTGNSVASECC